MYETLVSDLPHVFLRCHFYNANWKKFANYVRITGHIHIALNLIKMLLHDTCLMIKSSQNIPMFTIRFIRNSKRFSESNPLNNNKKSL